MVMTRNGMGDAVTAPLEDFGLRHDYIPHVLVEAAEAPYRRPSRMDCAMLGWEIAQLDRELGPDIDMPESDGGMVTQGSEAVAGAAVDAVRDLTTLDPVPQRVRRLTGAEKTRQARPARR